MVHLAEQIIAITDGQVDKLIEMTESGFCAISAAIKVIWAYVIPIMTPLISGYIALKVAKNNEEAKAARKTILEKIATESLTSQKDRDKIINDISENTKISATAFEAANSHNEKIAAVVDYMKPKP